MHEFSEYLHAYGTLLVEKMMFDKDNWKHGVGVPEQSIWR